MGEIQIWALERPRESRDCIKQSEDPTRRKPIVKPRFLPPRRAGGGKILSVNSPQNGDFLSHASGNWEGLLS